MNARKEIHCEFTGKSAHAGGNPWDGINALDALVSAYNNVSVLRQQMQPDERVHVAFTETPTVANVIPERTKAFWQVRSPTLKGLDRLMARVSNCIEAGALSSGCRVDIVEDQLYTDIKINDTLCERYQTHMARYGRKITKSHDKVMTGSSDIGNVSYLVPTLHAMFAVADQEGLFLHHSSFATAAGTDTAHEEAVIVGKSLAMIGWDMLTDEGLFQTAKKQWEMAIVE